MADVVKDTQHASEGNALLPMQYADKPNVSGVLGTLMNRVQELENTLYDVWFFLLLDNARGDQLDLWGKFLVQPRGGWTDAQYRAILRTRIRVYISKGRPEDVIAIARLALGDSNLEYLESYPASFEVQKDGIDPVLVAPSVQALHDGKPVGVRGQLFYSVDTPDETLHWGYGVDLSPKQTLWGAEPYSTSVHSNWAMEQVV